MAVCDKWVAWRSEDKGTLHLNGWPYKASKGIGGVINPFLGSGFDDLTSVVVTQNLVWAREALGGLGGGWRRFLWGQIMFLLPES